MKRALALVAILGLTQIGVVVAMTGTASALPPLTGSTNCTTSNGFVRFTQGLSVLAPNGNEKVEVEGTIQCTTGNVATPTITSLSGVFKGVIKFKKTPVPNKARECSNFEGLAPIDHIVAGSKFIVSWRAFNGTVAVPVAPSTVNYSGTYSAAVAGTTMTLAMGNVAATTTTVTGSFAGSTSQLLGANLTVPAGGCPVSSSSLLIPPNAETVQF